MVSLHRWTLSGQGTPKLHDCSPCCANGDTESEMQGEGDTEPKCFWGRGEKRSPRNHHWLDRAAQLWRCIKKGHTAPLPTVRIPSPQCPLSPSPLPAALEFLQLIILMNTRMQNRLRRWWDRDLRATKTCWIIPDFPGTLTALRKRSEGWEPAMRFKRDDLKITWSFPDPLSH